jgi:hypothetical protein
MARIDLFHTAFDAIDAPTLPELTVAEPPNDTPTRRGLRAAPRADRPTDRVSLDTGRRMMTDAITTYLADPLPSSMLLIAAPAGIGKTTIGVRTAEQTAAETRRVLYVGPRREFFADIQALATRPAWWTAWQPRHGGEGETGFGATCRWPDQISTWMNRGYAAKTFCSNPRICGWNYWHTTCRYHAQERTAGPIVFAQYEHIALGHPLMDQMALIIGDELPIRAFLHPWYIPPSAIVPPEITDPQAAAIARRLHTLATIPNTTWSGAELLEALGGAAAVAAACARFRQDVSFAAYEPELRGPNDAEDVPYFHLPQTLALLGREAERSAQNLPSISRVRVDVTGLTLLLRRAPRQLPPHVIWLDATANAPLYETLFGRPVTVLRPEVALQGRVRQVWAGLNNKQALAGQAPKTDHLRQQIARILSRGYTRPAFIGYKDLIRGLVPEGTAPDCLAHFGGSRGTNRLQDCDCLIVIGAPQPPTPQLLDMAAMLYHERDEPFTATWSTRDIPYAGQPWAWPIGGFWDDAQLQALIEQTRESELVQAIHRARPLIRDVDIWLLTNVPLPNIPVELVSLHTLFDAPVGVDAYRWPEVVAVAQARMDAAELVTTADLVDAKLCQAAAARRYLEALAAQFGWKLITAPASGRGKPPLACVKHKWAANIDLSPISNL